MAVSRDSEFANLLLARWPIVSERRASAARFVRFILQLKTLTAKSEDIDRFKSQTGNAFAVAGEFPFPDLCLRSFYFVGDNVQEGDREIH